MILDKVNSPKDVKELNISQMTELACDMRNAIIKKVNTTGGHFGPNMGFVEATIALHYVFNSPEDKFVFDVSHQCYPHKILTGRKEGFLNPESYGKYSGYTNPNESEHDQFIVGHTSTSVSLACGLAKGRDLKGEKYNVIAIIGDGSLSGGEAYEGLNNGADLNSNFIVVVNDNEMSIAVNQGGLYRNLKELRETNGKAECNFFKSLGYDYYYVADGNDLSSLIEVFEKVKDTNKPTVIHLHTLKGKGLKASEENKEMFHWIMPNTLDENGNIVPSGNSFKEDYYSITNEFMLGKKSQGVPILSITPATPGATGFSQDYRDKMGNNFRDVGIAEEHAVALASGVAKAGARPVMSVLSSFIQRAYDQLSQDLALNNSPAVILVNWGGLSPMDATHVGCFDIPLISNIPNIVYLAPTCKEEYLKMLDWATTQDMYPVAIRTPFTNYISTGIYDNTDYSILNKFEVKENGSEIAIVAVGDFFELGKSVKELIKSKLNINSTLINPKFISGLDKELLENLKQNHKIVITLENGILEGGFGQKIASFYGNSKMLVLNFGGKKIFTDRVPMDEILRENHLTPELIASDIEKCLNSLTVEV